jgi:hypothetical protein
MGIEMLRSEGTPCILKISEKAFGETFNRSHTADKPMKENDYIYVVFDMRSLEEKKGQRVDCSEK